MVLTLYAFPFPSFPPVLEFSRETESIESDGWIYISINLFTYFKELAHDYGRMSRSAADKLKTQESQWLSSSRKAREELCSSSKTGKWRELILSPLLLMFYSGQQIRRGLPPLWMTIFLTQPPDSNANLTQKHPHTHLEQC